jgi:hypothetical protein
MKRTDPSSGHGSCSQLSPAGHRADANPPLTLAQEHLGSHPRGHTGEARIPVSTGMVVRAPTAQSMNDRAQLDAQGAAGARFRELRSPGRGMHLACGHQPSRVAGSASADGARDSGRVSVERKTPTHNRLREGTGHTVRYNQSPRKSQTDAGCINVYGPQTSVSPANGLREGLPALHSARIRAVARRGRQTKLTLHQRRRRPDDC